MTYTDQFGIGDIVVRIGGRKPAQIERTTWRTKDSYNGTHWYCKYLPPGKGGFETYDGLLKPYDNPEETMSETKTLYSFKKEDGTIGYGSHIGTNSSNNYLIEEKGTGEIHVFNVKDLEEVLPYTFSATIAGKETHYVCAPDAVKKGDYLLYTSGSTPQIAVVTAIDTKNKAARSKFRGKRLLLEDL
jgi:hypothetical protein